VPQIEEVHIASMDPTRFETVLSAHDYAGLLRLIENGAEALAGRVIWNVNSTARGGGVAEMLAPLLGYSRGAGVDARWVVIGGDPEFFAVTKRIHNHLHGFDGDGGDLGTAEKVTYERTLAEDSEALVSMVSPNDIVILHDPQTAGLVRAVKRTNATVIWRCHIGLDRPNDRARGAWDFLRPYVKQADAYVFSRLAYAWEGLEPKRVSVIQPSIDVFSPKNAGQTREQSLAILARAGLIANGPDVAPTFTRSDGTPGRVGRQAEMLQDEQLTPENTVVAQVSRWDGLKDPLGVLKGFAEYVAEHVPAHLLLAGPSTASVADDPEGASTFAEVRDAWSQLPDGIRSRVHLVSLPMDDAEENAAIVNAMQQHADVVVQKSLAEGFGLTVAEAMWKQRPVVASRIGGIQDQIVDGESGVLIDDPHDLEQFGSSIVDLLNHPDRRKQIGDAARNRVRHQFLGPHHLGRYFELISQLIGGQPPG
jgi:trehalose synthase